MSKIFISYRREDSGGWAGRLADRLQQRFGHDQIFMDVDTLQPGADFDEAIKEAVGSCDVMLAVIGRSWLTAVDAQGRRRLDDPEDFTRVEIATALERKVRVIPVLVNGAAMPSLEHLPGDLSRLARKQALELSDQRWNTDAQRLIDSIEKPLGGAAPRVPKTMPGMASTPSGAADLSTTGPSAASKVPEPAPGPPVSAITASEVPRPERVRNRPIEPESRASNAGKWALAVGLLVLGWGVLPVTGLGILGTMIIGLAAGVLAKALMPSDGGGGMIAAGLLGLAGALLAGFLGRALGWYADPTGGPGIIASILGAMVLVMLQRLLGRRGARLQ